MKSSTIYGIKRVFCHQFEHFLCLTWKSENWSTLNNYQTEWLTIRADWHQHGHKQFLALFFPFQRESAFKTSHQGHLNLKSLISFSLLLRVFNFNPSVAEGTERALFYFIKIVLSLCVQHLTGVTKVVLDQKPKNLKYKGKPANIEDIREFEWTDRNDGWSTSREMTSVRSSGEC